MNGIRILLVGGHELVRCGVRGMLEQEEDMEIVGDCFSAEEALLQRKTPSPDIILIEDKMPGIGGIEAIRHLRQKWAHCSVIMLTLHEDCLVGALEAGGAGYLRLEDIKHQELAQAIRRVYHGELVIDERLTLIPQVEEGESEYLPPEGNGSGNLVREVELVIPPPADAARLLRFAYQVENALEAAIVQQVGSWDGGAAITIWRRTATPLVDILDRLGKMPDVEGVREKPASKYKSFSLPKKIIATPGTHPRKELLVTLKQASTAKQLELAGLSIS